MDLDDDLNDAENADDAEGDIGDGTEADAAAARAAADSGMSVALFLAGQKATLSPQRCGRCGITFVVADRLVAVHGYEKAKWSLDIGGYCPRCELYVCHLDAHFDQVKLDNSVKGEGAGNWKLVCTSCGVVLLAARGGSKEPDLIIFYVG
jgi:hypothetical protein